MKLFLERNRDKIISQRGKTAGQVKASFKQADKMIAAFRKRGAILIVCIMVQMMNGGERTDYHWYVRRDSLQVQKLIV